MAPAWTPRQLQVLELLGWAPDLTFEVPPPAFGVDEVVRLRGLLERGLAPVVDLIADRPLELRKHDLTAVIKCERFFLAPSNFAWSPNNLRGKIVARAIQISLTGAGRSKTPLELVQAAVDGFMRGEDDLGGYLSSIDSGTLADVLSGSSAAVTTFFADFPPIEPKSIPRIECSVNVPILDGRIILKGRYDLALGPPGRGTIILDLKTGDERQEHSEEIRYYGLLETLARGVPPYRLSTYYLDGSWHRAYDVDAGVIEAAVRRTIEAATRVAELYAGARESVLTPGPHCHYCPVSFDCGPGRGWIERTRHERVTFLESPRQDGQPWLAAP